MAKTKVECVRSLADKCVTAKLFHGPRVTQVDAEYLIEDGRKRKSMFKELCQDGYITQPDDKGRGTVTSKAFDELPAEPVTLADMVKFDVHKEGKDYVVWDRLTIGQKKTIILALEADPASYTLAVAEEYSRPAKLFPFVLGEAGKAMEDSGGWNMGKLVVYDGSVITKMQNAGKDHYRQECRSKGLNWFLSQQEKIGVVDVPVMDKQPFLGQCPSLDRDPAKWEASLPDAVKRTMEKIAEHTQRLEALQKLEQTVVLMGGWDAFLAKYDAAIDTYVNEHYK